MNNFYTYIYFDPFRAEPIYVGKGKGKRAYSHMKRSDNHPLTNRLIYMRRNGVEPIILFLCQNVDEELAFLVEEEAVLKYGRKNIQTGSLLNLTEGGFGKGNGGAVRGRKQTKEHIAKRISKNFGKKRSPDQIARLAGWVRTEEMKQKISERFKGKPQKTITCPICGKIGGIMVMKRWHFDNCRSM